MKKTFKAFIIFTILVCTIIKLYPVKAEQISEPPYAKWGKIAVLSTKERYPQADVVDYLHIGREQKTTSVSIEKFKLWLRMKDGSREFGVFVNVEFEPRTEKYLGISYRETDR